MTICKKYFLFVLLIACCAAACKKKPDTDSSLPLTVPQVTTAPVTNITATSATGGGAITSDGGSKVTVSGICWSKNNINPTIADDTVKTATGTGTFTGIMTNLNSNAVYYVRAYAGNSIGTGYGPVVTFRSLNKAPEVKNITIAGNIEVLETITVRYSYVDAENDAEGASSFQWYVANDTTGSPVTAISNGKTSSYSIQSADENKFLKVAIVPKALTGSTTGTETSSAWIGPVKAAVNATVTFVYNGQSVTYGIITSPVTHRKWLDRNLGAPNAPNAYNDWANEGDLFQWGRQADGHQLINRAPTTSGTTGVNGTTTTIATTTAPGHSLFILPASAPFDWHIPQDAGLWQETGGTNNVCPTGWHVPTLDEWRAENLGSVQDAYTNLKITTGGTRNFNDGKFSLTLDNGAYWTSTIFTGVQLFPYCFNFSTVIAPAFSSTANVNANGLSVRCIKN